MVFLCQFLWLAPQHRAWKPLQLPPLVSIQGLKNTPAASTLSTAAFATFLACLLPKCLLVLKLAAFRRSTQGLENQPAAYPLPHLLLPRSWPACCLSSTHVCCQMVVLCQFLWLAPVRFAKVNAGLEKTPSSFHPWPQSRALKSLQLPALATSACWAWNFHFSTVQKVTLDSAVCGRRQPAEKPRAGKINLQLLRFSAPGFATFLACLLPKPLPFPPTPVAKWCFYASSFG